MQAEIEKLKEDSQKLIAQVKTIDTKLTTSFNEVNSKVRYKVLIINDNYTNICIMLKVISLRTQIDKIATNVTSLHAQSNSDDSLTSSGQLKGKVFGLLYLNKLYYMFMLLVLVNITSIFTYW